MALDITNNQAVTDFVNRLYRENLGGNAGQEGHDYWGGQIRAGTLDPNDLAGHLQWSHEGRQYADRKAADTAAGIDTTERWVGGVNPNVSLQAQLEDNRANLDANTENYAPAWLGHYDAGIGGTRQTGNALGDLQNINSELGLDRTYTSFDTNSTQNIVQNALNNAANNNSTDGTDGTDGTDTSTNWWDQYADIDAFKDALGLGTSSSSSGGGMDDFMKFMMFMSMMRPQGGMGGGSQYGYGGLNPGGVMSAYNPMDNIQSAISAFQSIPGIGTNLTNTGTATATS